MNKFDNKYFQELLIKFFAGEAGPEEAMLIHEWVKVPANRSDYESTLVLWNASGNQRVPAVIDAGISWKQLQQQISTKANETKLRRMNIRYLLVGAAAIIGIVIVSFFVFERRDVPPENTAITIEKAGDSIRSITLIDGSIIALNKKSEISYDPSFNTNKRAVQLRGESYFDIKKDPVKPFIITTGDLTIEVVGTSFNVRTEAEGSSIEVQVKTGIVKMMSREREITVTKGQTGIYFTGSRKLLIKEGIDVNAMSYATRNFQFNDQSLTEVCRYLEKSFDVRVDIDKSKFSDCRITAEFNNKSLTYILDVITATVQAKYRMANEQIYIEGKGCQ